MEKFLLERLESNRKLGIAPSESTLIERLLGRSTEMIPVYNELQRSLNPVQQEHFVELLISVSTYWNTESSTAIRNDLARVGELNSEIAILAGKLTNLMRIRERITNTSSVSSPTNTILFI